MIHPNVLIGGNRKSGSPIIGNRVFIGNGSKIIGKVKIGNNVFISPGAMITKDVSDDAIVGYGLNNLLHSTGGETEVNRYISTID